MRLISWLKLMFRHSRIKIRKARRLLDVAIGDNYPPIPLGKISL